jgi:hypothetical protein
LPRDPYSEQFEEEEQDIAVTVPRHLFLLETVHDVLQATDFKQLEKQFVSGKDDPKFELHELCVQSIVS